MCQLNYRLIQDSVQMERAGENSASEKLQYFIVYIGVTGIYKGHALQAVQGLSP